MDYYDRVIPADRPLEDELHMNFYHKYQEQKASGVIELDPNKRFGAPLSTEEHGVIHTAYKYKPDGKA